MNYGVDFDDVNDAMNVVVIETEIVELVDHVENEKIVGIVMTVVDVVMKSLLVIESCYCYLFVDFLKRQQLLQHCLIVVKAIDCY